MSYYGLWSQDPQIKQLKKQVAYAKYCAARAEGQLHDLEYNAREVLGRIEISSHENRVIRVCYDVDPRVFESANEKNFIDALARQLSVSFVSFIKNERR